MGQPDVSAFSGIVMSNIIKNYLNAQYQYRLDTDVLFEKPQMKVELGGLSNKAVNFVIGHQLTNTDLWTTFVDQYRIQNDGPEQRWRGEYWGKMMRGACFMYKATQNPELYKSIVKSILDMLSTQDEDGRFSTYKKEYEFKGWDIWCRKYVMLGFIYFLEISKDKELNVKVLEAVKKHADYIINNVNEGKIDLFETAYCWGCLQSSSILEPFIKLYALTDDQKYFEYAKYIVNKGGSSMGNMIEAALDKNKMPSEYPVTKAYECMSFFEGVAEFYSVTKEEKYKEAFLNFVNQIIKTDFTVVGGTGTYDELFDNSTEHQTEYRVEVMQETCVTVTLLKVLVRALELTEDPLFADKIEVAYYNCLMNATNFNKNDELYWGKEFIEQYDMDYSPTSAWVKKIKGYTFDSYTPLYKQSRNRKTGGFNFMEGGKSYGCCACIGSLGTSILPLYAVMNSKKGIVINFFDTATYEFLTPNGQKGLVEIEGHYPMDGALKIYARVPNPEKFSIKVRVPEFVDKAVINGIEVEKGSYYEIDKEWNNDIIPINFEFGLVAKELKDKIYVTKGPIVFAADDRIQDLDVKATNEIKEFKKIKTPFESNEAFDVTFSNGNAIKLVDYGSSGSNWHRGENKISVFLDK